MNIFVGNLSLEATVEELQREFSAFGEVESVTIMNDRYIGSGQSSGYGFVEMPSLSEGQAAITALNGQSLRHRAIDVIQALPLSGITVKGSHGDKGGKRAFARGVRERNPELPVTRSVPQTLDKRSP